MTGCLQLLMGLGFEKAFPLLNLGHEELQKLISALEFLPVERDLERKSEEMIDAISIRDLESNQEITIYCKINSQGTKSELDAREDRLVYIMSFSEYSSIKK